MSIQETRQFKKDIKRLKKQGKYLKKLYTVIQILYESNPLERKYRDHKLVGNFSSYRECHIEPDWLLVYKIENATLFLIQTGSHQELFDF